MIQKVFVLLILFGMLGWTSVALAEDAEEVPSQQRAGFELTPTLLWQTQVVSSHAAFPRSEANALPQLRFRRLRPGLELGLWEDRVRAELVVSVLPGELELIEAHTSLELGASHMLRVGQFKIPFMRYRMNSGTRLVLVDWSFHTEYIGGERQLGVAFGNDARSNGVFRYEVGLFTGQNARNSHGIGIGLLYGEALPHEPAALVDAEREPYEGFDRPELAMHFGFALGGMDPSTIDDLERGDRLRAYIGAGATLHDATPFIEHQMRSALEGMLKWRGWGLYTGVYHGMNMAFQHQDSISPFSGYGGVLGSASYRFQSVPLSLGVRSSWLRLHEELVTDISIRAQSYGDLDRDRLRFFREHTAGGRWDAYQDIVSLGADVGVYTRGVRELPGGDRFSRGWMARFQVQLRI